MEAYTPNLDIEQITTNLKVNPETPYKREILSVEPLDPSKCRVVFHTAAQEYTIVDPSKCTSFDFVINGKPLQVSYVLPYPHVNRVKGVSEVFSPTRIQAQNKHGFSHSYLTIVDSQEAPPYAQIRLGSTLENCFLLACQNIGGAVFEVRMRAEGGVDYLEHVSIKPLRTLLVHMFDDKSPIGYATGGRLETHSSVSIPTPDLVGYNALSTKVLKMFPAEDRAKIIELRTRLSQAHNSGEDPLASVFPELIPGIDYIKPQEVLRKI